METFRELIQSEKPVLVDFHADWCGPCKSMHPVIQEIARTVAGKARVVKIDIDKNAPTAQAYNIVSVPTFIVFKKGAVIWRHSGTIDKNSLLSVLNQNV